MIDFPTDDRAGADDREERKLLGQQLLARLIPLETWLGTRPRTDGDCDIYFMIDELVRSLAESGTPGGSPGEIKLWYAAKNREDGGLMSVSEATRNEDEFFYLLDD